MLDWLLLPIDSSRAHEVGVLVSWHGRLMVLAASVLFPLGILAARYFKVMPRQDWPRVLDNTVWWHLHLTSQYLGGLCLGLAVGLALISQENTAVGTWHSLTGWLAAALLSLQFASGWLRGSKGGPTDPAPDGSFRGDHYDMSVRRRIFEYYHKFFGYLAVLAAWLASLHGLWLTNAPRWIWLMLGSWWIALLIMGILLQRRGRCVDTYQAIWGDRPELPGNRRQPIGFGICRRRS